MGLRPVERQEARRPSIRDAKSVQVVEDTGKGDSRKSKDSNCTKMAAADCRRKSSRQRLVAQESVQIGRNLGNANGMPLGRDTSMQIGQGVLVIERSDFRQDRRQQIDGTICLLNEALEVLLVRACTARPRVAFWRIINRAIVL